jgi:hypothetical protein
MEMALANAFPTQIDAKGHQELRINAPEIYVMDCGAWQNRQQGFGALCGSYLVLGTFTGPTVEFPAEIKNEKLRKLFADSGARVLAAPKGAGAWKMVLPLNENENARKLSLLSGEDQLFVFIPDMHMGMRDRADDFAQHGRDHLANLKKLDDFLRVAKGLSLSATVIQMGDLYDIWEGEAKRSVYYEYSQVHSPRLRPSSARTDAAMKGILEAWKQSDSAEMFKNVRGNIDHYLPGNHDIEIKWISGPDGTDARQSYARTPSGMSRIL